jgi:hypothetical protein
MLPTSRSSTTSNWPGCDVCKPRLEEGLQYTGNPRAKGYGDFRQMLDDKNIQGVVVATGPLACAFTIMACAAAGCLRREADDGIQ